MYWGNSQVLACFSLHLLFMVTLSLLDSGSKLSVYAVLRDSSHVNGCDYIKEVLFSYQQVLSCSVTSQWIIYWVPILQIIRFSHTVSHTVCTL